METLAVSRTASSLRWEYTLDDVIAFAWDRHEAWRGGVVLDDVVSRYKFTNVFRVIDRGSQYLLSLLNVLDDRHDQLALSYFYRQVNRPDTMDAVISSNGGFIPSFDEITSAEWIKDVVWPVIAARPGDFLNGAYIILIMTNDKRTLSDKMADIFPGAAQYLSAVAEEDSLATRVKLLQKTPGLGPFLSMQIATDLGYCAGEPDQENTFILPGPGSRKGVAAVSSKKAEEVIRMFPYDEMPTLPGSNGRPPSWMDVQNVFCEFSKYVRYWEHPDLVAAREPYRRSNPFDVAIPQQFKIRRKKV